ECAEAERVDEVEEECSALAPRRVDATVEKGVLAGARGAPLPGDALPRSPVVIVVRLRAVEALAVRPDADASGRARAQRGHRVASPALPRPSDRPGRRRLREGSRTPSASGRRRGR